jgi:polygalacturonase
MRSAIVITLLTSVLGIATARPAGSGGASSAPTASSLGRVGAELARPFDVRAFGATGDGKTLDAAAINRAIDAAAARSAARRRGAGGFLMRIAR